MIAFYMVRLVERVLSMKKSHHTVSDVDIQRIVTICLGGSR